MRKARFGAGSQAVIAINVFWGNVLLAKTIKAWIFNICWCGLALPWRNIPKLIAVKNQKPNAANKGFGADHFYGLKIGAADKTVSNLRRLTFPIKRDL